MDFKEKTLEIIEDLAEVYYEEGRTEEAAVLMIAYIRINKIYEDEDEEIN